LAEKAASMTESSPQKQRRLKVSYRPVRSHSRESVKRNLVPMPYVRLVGRWLDEAGFAIGCDISVQVSSGKLVLEVIEPAATDKAKS
jgi:toxic protein SymE